MNYLRNRKTGEILPMNADTAQSDDMELYQMPNKKRMKKVRGVATVPLTKNERMALEGNDFVDDGAASDLPPMIDPLTGEEIDLEAPTIVDDEAQEPTMDDEVSALNDMISGKSPDPVEVQAIENGDPLPLDSMAPSDDIEIDLDSESLDVDATDVDDPQ